MSNSIRKKAKLAHESKQRSSGVNQSMNNRFSFHSAVEFVEFEGVRALVVELDEGGVRGLVEPFFVSEMRDGSLLPSSLACPAAYDPVARERAVTSYERYVRSKGQVEQGG